MKNLKINEKNTEKLILARIKLGLAGLGMVATLNGGSIDVYASEPEVATVEGNAEVNVTELEVATIQEDIVSGAIGTPVEDNVQTNNGEGFYDEKQFKKDLAIDPTIGQTIDPNVVQTEAERKGIEITPEPTPIITPEPTPEITPEPTPEETPVVEVVEKVSRPIPKMGKEKNIIKFVIGTAALLVVANTCVTIFKTNKLEDLEEIYENTKRK